MSARDFISHPISSIHGEVTVPGDKSISHRSIIFGALAKGTTVVDGFLDGDDCLATIKAFQAMGVVIEGPVNQRVVIHGVGKLGLQQPQEVIDCGNSGTSIRLLAGLLAAQAFDSTLTGDESLLKRPMLRVSKPLELMGANISTHEGKPPLTIKGGAALQAIDYVMPVVSAQVKSCILLAAMYAKGKTRITETGISRNHTELMLKAFSYPVALAYESIVIDGEGECTATHISVPGDISSAAFFMVAASIIPGSSIILRKVGINPTRTGVISILTEMGADITLLNQRTAGDELVADIQVNYAPLHGITISPDLVPLAIDEFPAIFIAAACATGQTILHGAKELRVKESDRIGAMVDGLKTLGIDAVDFEDGLQINGGVIGGGVVNSLGDHRIAMSFAIAGAVAKSPIIIKNCANVATSFPGFISTAQAVHLKIEDVTNND